MSGASGALVPAELDLPSGQALLDAARGLDPLSARARLARRFPDAGPELLRAAVAQAALQQRAAGRFPHAAQMWWTGEGLEQASRPAASEYRAEVLRAAGITHGVDLTCGLGLDLIAMAHGGLQMVGVDQDPAIAELAARNAARLGMSDRVEVITGSCRDADLLASLPSGGVWFVDPARRTGTRRADGTHVRLRDPEQWSPPWSWVIGLADRVGSPAGPDVLVAKSSPAIAHDLVAAGATEWLSVKGELVEATVWWGLGVPGARCAVLLGAQDSDGTTAPVVRVCAEGSEVAVSGLPEEGNWLIEPDPAVIRAGAVADLGAAIDATLIDAHLAYLSAAEPLADDDARGRSWQVLWAGGYDPRALRTACAASSVTRVDLSGRGRNLDPQRVDRDLRLPGGAGRSAKLFALGLGSPRRTAVILAINPVAPRR